jgi:hypothetical protein
MMITHKTFSKKAMLTYKDIQEVQEEVRKEAEAFILRELDSDQVINISELAVLVPLGMTWNLVSATVWYKDR